MPTEEKEPMAKLSTEALRVSLSIAKPEVQDKINKEIEKRTTEIIGYLFKDKAVVCESCAGTDLKKNGVKLYHRHIFPFSQKCSVCRKTLVTGDSPSRPELYD